MPQVVNCPRCQRPARVPDSLMGQKVKCPGCNEVFTAEVPAPPAQTEPGPQKESSRRRAADDEAVSDRARSRPDRETDDEDDRPRRSRTREDDEDDEPRRRRRRSGREDDDDDDEEARPRRSAPPAQPTDTCGIISVIVGAVALVLLPVGCCCAPLWFGVIPLALAGGVLTIWARGGMRVAGLILNICAAVPAIAFVILFIIVGISAPFMNAAGANGAGGTARSGPGPWCQGRRRGSSRVGRVFETHRGHRWVSKTRPTLHSP